MKKIIAGFMTALMALLTVSTPVLAANTVADFPGMLAGSDGALNAYVVVGSSAATSDVAGAIDIAVRLPEVGSDEVSLTCSSTSSVEGTTKDTVGLHELLSAQFPSSAILKTAHYTGLKDESYSWSGSASTTYQYREQVNIAGVQMRHDLALSNVNGTEKMVVETGDIKYQFVFEKDLTHGGKIASPNYTYPINIKLLGTDFAIVGSDTNRVLMLHGSVGTATATSGVTYGDYTVYAVTGVNAGWATLRIDDADGNEVETLTVDQGSSKSSTTAGITIQVTSVRSLQDGTTYADVVVGPTTEGTTKTYDTTADITSSGTSSDRFPGETLWGIKVGTNTLTSAASFATDAKISNGDVIEVEYKPTSTQYLVAGESISLPNDYATLSFEGWNTDTFATITIEKLSGTLSAYNNSDETQAFGNLDGIKISTDVPGSIVSGANNGYSEAYLLFNYTRSFSILSGEATDMVYDVLPVMLGFKDTSTDKIIVNGTFPTGNITHADTQEYISKLLLADAQYNATHPYRFNSSLKLSYGNSADQAFYMYITVLGERLIHSIGIGKVTTSTVNMTWANNSLGSSSQAPSFRLGATVSSAEVTELNVTTEGNVRNAGKKTQEIVDDSGVILLNTESNGASDKVVFKIPFKDLKAKVSFGSQTGTQTTSSSDTYTDYPSIPVTSTIAKLDSEMSSLKTAKHLILVGGPCVNTLVAELADDGEFSYTCDAWPGRDFGLIEVIDDGFATGKVVLVVAGTRAEDTRVAASAVQQYDTKLTSETGTSVEVTGSVGSPVVG